MSALLSSYLSLLVAERLATRTTPLREPEASYALGAVMLTDIASFTGVVEKSLESREAFENLTRDFDRYFSRLVEIVYLNGGDVLTVAGDAFFCFWPAADEAQLSEAVRRAAQAALEIQQDLAVLSVDARANFATRIGIAAGELTIAFVGGYGGNWALVAAGLPARKAAEVEGSVPAGMVGLSTESWNLVQGYCSGHPIAADLYIVDQVLTPLMPLPTAERPSLPESTLRPWLPPLLPVDLDQSRAAWIAEVRRVTVLVTQLREIVAVTPETVGDFHRQVRAFQTIADRYEGAVRLTLDDKGVIAVLIFGLPGTAHDDDAERAIQAAQELRRTFREMEVASGIAISSGRAFCGTFGSDLRREYTLHGDVINVAAGLMQSTAREILCHQATAEAVRGRYTFEVLPPIVVKGKAQPIYAYHPLSRVHRQSNAGTPLVGREDEVEVLTAGIKKVWAGDNAGVVVISGEAGIGKSRLVAEVVRRAEDAGARVLIGRADAVEQSTPYFAWRSVVASAIGFGPTDSPEQIRTRIHEYMVALPAVERLAPLLSTVLPVQLPDNELTQQLSGGARAENTDRILLAILERYAEAGPTALVVDDAHWLDSASWRLLAQVGESIGPLLMVLAVRSEASMTSVEFERLAESEQSRVLQLEGLAADEITELACQFLGVTALPAALHEFISERASGHPFFCEELLRTMREVGAIRVVGNRCFVGDLESLEVPTTIEEIILGRLDRLTARQQFCLKVASVAGPVFQHETIREVHPVPGERAFVAGHLETLAGLGLILDEAPGNDATYRFKHQITRDVTYALMTKSQTRPLHRALAEWYERTNSEDLPSHYALLAHHWALAGDTGRTLDYLEKAGELALERGAFTEALNFYARARGMDGSEGVETPRLRRAAWDRGIGTSHYFLGDLQRAQLHLEMAVAHLHRPIPSDSAEINRAIRAQICRQAVHRLLPRRFLGCRASQKLQLDQAVECYRVLGQIYYLNGEPANRLVYLTLAGLNLGEESGASPALARILVNSSALLSLLGFRRFSDWYGSRAKEMARAEGRYSAAAYVWHITALKAAQLGQWEAAKSANSKAMVLLQDLGDRSLEAELWVVRATILLCEGNFAAAPGAWASARELAVRVGNAQILCWTLLDEVETLLAQGDVDAADVALSAGMAVPTAEADGSSTVEKFRALAATRLAQGRFEEAVEAADAVIQLVAAKPPTGYHWVDCAAAAVEVYLDVLEGRDVFARAYRMDVMRKAAFGCHVVKRLSRTFGSIRPRTYLLSGRLHWHQGRSRRALRAWRAAEKEATRMSMPFERARARFEIGRHGLTEQPEMFLRDAARTFGSLGARQFEAATLAIRDPVPSKEWADVL